MTLNEVMADLREQYKALGEQPERWEPAVTDAAARLLEALPYRGLPRQWRDRDTSALQATIEAAVQADDPEAVLLAATEELGAPYEETGDDWTPRPPARRWFIPDWLPAGRAGMLTGEGAAGKSRLALQLAAAVAAGQPDWLPGSAFRLALTGPEVAVLASWEDESEETARRLHGLGLAAAVGGRLRYVAPSGVLWEPDPTGSRHTSTVGVLSNAGRWLRAYCEQWQARLLVIDPRASAYGLNENDRALVRAFMADWDFWGRQADCAVMLITHPPKSDALSCLKTSYARRPGSYWLSGYPGWKVTDALNAAADWREVKGQQHDTAHNGGERERPRYV